jgi:NAD(P)-dependent dehydrogenase (short-subunit alcohol dehydrogenase family)
MFKGKVVVVTGGTRGIGNTIARAFYDAGADVAICGASEATVAYAIEKFVDNGQNRFFALKSDLSDFEEGKQFIEKVITRFGQIDILVNNAGIISGKTLAELTPEHFEKVMNVNVRAPLFLSEQVARHLIDRGVTGEIINISSIAASPQKNDEDNVLYGMTKAAIDKLTKGLAKVYGKNGIRVNAVAPGSIPTDITKERYADSAVVEELVCRLPLGRRGERMEIADAVLFLASNHSSYITGQTIVVDGGWLLS